MKYLLSAALIAAALLIGCSLIPRPVSAMAAQFGEYSEGYLKRKAERAEKRKTRPSTPDAGGCFYQLTEQEKQASGVECFYRPRGPDGCLPETCREGAK